MGKFRREIREQEANRKKNERIKIAVGAALVMAATGGVIGTAIYLNHQDTYGTYCKVGEHDVSRLEFEFYYNSTVNNFLNSYGNYISYLGLDTSKPFSEQEYEDGKTWEEYFQEQALELMKEVYILSDASKEDKFEFDSSKYDEFYDSINEYAKEYEVSTEQYLKEMYGSRATKSNLKEIIKNYLLASDYASYLQEEKLTPTDEEIKTYYEENKDDYDEVTYRLFSFEADPSILDSQGNIEVEADKKTNESTTDKSATEKMDSESSEEVTESSETSEETSEETTDENYTTEEWDAAMEMAKSKANEFFEQVYDEETFKELCVKYSNEDLKSDYEEDDISLHSSEKKSEMPTAISEWLMDEEREKDATAVIEDKENHIYYVVFFMSRQRDDSPTVDVRHILVTPEEVEPLDDGATDDEKAEYEQKVEDANKKAKEEAEQILEDWKNGEATEESFAALADEKSADSPSGGLYEGVEKGDMLTEFNDWIFDENRKEGDTDIVETEVGFHVMYFVGQDDPAWKNNIRETLISKAYNDFVKEKIENYEFEDVKGELSNLVAEDAEDSAEIDDTSSSSEASSVSSETTSSDEASSESENPASSTENSVETNSKTEEVSE